MYAVISKNHMSGNISQIIIGNIKAVRPQWHKNGEVHEVKLVTYDDRIITIANPEQGMISQTIEIFNKSTDKDIGIPISLSRKGNKQ
jgi:hypothetical protein